MNIAVNQSKPLDTLTTKAVSADKKTITSQTLQAAALSLKTDQAEISQSKLQKGILPSLKGAGSGLLMGGVAAGTGAYGANLMMGAITGNVDEAASLAIVMGGGLGAMAGAVIGAAVANYTDDKKKAAIYGAAIGGGLGLTIGLAGGGLGSALTWGALGVGAGVGGAYGGAAVAKKLSN